MNNYDYVILFDENGQPYIEHSLWSSAKSWGKKAHSRVRSAGKTAHKYIMKVGEGAKAQYAYTQAEVDRLMGRGRKAAQKVSSSAKKAAASVKRAGIRAADRFGVDEKVRRDKALDRYHDKNSIKNAQDYLNANRDYLNTPLGKIDNTFKKAQETLKSTTKDLKRGADNLAKNAREAAARVKSTVDDVKEYVSAINDYNKAADELRDAFSDGAMNAGGYIYSVNNTERKQAEAMERARATKIGQWADRHKEDFDHIGENLAKADAAAKTLIDSVKETAEKAANTVSSTARNAADRVSSADEKRELDAARREYEKVRGTGGEDENDAYWALREAENAYNRTAGGAAANAANAVSSSARNAAGAMRNAAGAVSDAAKNVADRVSGKTKAQAQSEYNAALREYEKLRGTGSGEESDAYWALREAELALERAGGKIKR